MHDHLLTQQAMKNQRRLYVQHFIEHLVYLDEEEVDGVVDRWFLVLDEQQLKQDILYSRRSLRFTSTTSQECLNQALRWCPDMPAGGEK
jgi:hypothetical protein